MPTAYKCAHPTHTCMCKHTHAGTSCWLSGPLMYSQPFLTRRCLSLLHLPPLFYHLVWTNLKQTDNTDVDGAREESYRDSFNVICSQDNYVNLPFVKGNWSSLFGCHRQKTGKVLTYLGPTHYRPLHRVIELADYAFWTFTVSQIFIINLGSYHGQCSMCNGRQNTRWSHRCHFCGGFNLENVQAIKPCRCFHTNLKCSTYSWSIFTLLDTSICSLKIWQSASNNNRDPQIMMPCHATWEMCLSSASGIFCQLMELRDEGWNWEALPQGEHNQSCDISDRLQTITSDIETGWPLILCLRPRLILPPQRFCFYLSDDTVITGKELPPFVENRNHTVSVVSSVHHTLIICY